MVHTHINLPVIKRRPLASCLRTITRLPLWTPPRRIATAPGAKLGLKDLLCFEKKFLDVFAGALKIRCTTVKINSLLN